jgi:hypothetical protein
MTLEKARDYILPGVWGLFGPKKRRWELRVEGDHIALVEEVSRHIVATKQEVEDCEFTKITARIRSVAESAE